MQKFNPKRIKSINIINKLLCIFFYTQKNINHRVSWKKVNRILIIDMTLIGDIIMLIPFLNVLKKNALSASIDLVCGSWGQTILEDQNLIDVFYILEGKQIESIKQMINNRKKIVNVLKKIRKNKYDIIIEPRGDLRYIFFMYWCIGKRKISYNYTGGECFLTDVILPCEAIKHLVDDKLYLLAKLGCIYTDDDRTPVLDRTCEYKNFTVVYKDEKHLNKKQIIGIHPGASIPMKEWKKYSDLIKKINTEYSDVVFIIFKGPCEQKVVENVCEVAKKINCKYIVSETNLKDYIKIISICSLIICNDSGAGHIAVALGVPTIVIMGSYYPDYCAPIGKKVITCSKELSCKPCLSIKCKENVQKCLDMITVDEVFEKIILFINRDKKHELN